MFLFWSVCQFTLQYFDSPGCQLAENSVLQPWKPVNKVSQRSQILPDLKSLGIHLNSSTDRGKINTDIWQPGLDWDKKKSALAFFWSRRPTTTSNYIYIYIYIFKNMYRPDSASAHRENARYARLPVQPCWQPAWALSLRRRERE